MLIYNLFTLLHVAYVERGIGMGVGGGGLDEALNKSNLQHVTTTWHGLCIQKQMVAWLLV
jgi:hypothetical protein